MIFEITRSVNMHEKFKHCFQELRIFIFSLLPVRGITHLIKITDIFKVV